MEISWWSKISVDRKIKKIHDTEIKICSTCQTLEKVWSRNIPWHGKKGFDAKCHLRFL